VFDFVHLEIDQDEATEVAVVEDEIDVVVGVVQRDPVLPPDKGETLSQFQKEGLEVVAETGFEIGFRKCDKARAL
jgi:hypothetical protein